MKILKLPIHSYLVRNVLGINIRNDNPRASTKFIRNLNKFNSKSLTGVEIGVFDGYNALSILKNLKINKLYLVDPYVVYEDQLNLMNERVRWAEKKSKRRLKRQRSKIIRIKKFSSEAINDLPDNLDFVYIDGNHDYEYVKEDIEKYYEKLREGGVLAGHDIENGFTEIHDGVVRAFMEFVFKNKLKPYIHAPDWWIVKKSHKN